MDGPTHVHLRDRRTDNVVAMCVRGTPIATPVCTWLTEKRVTPIEKVIQFMKDREYRTSEFFRILDKDGSKNLTHDELASRMQVGQRHVYLPRYSVTLERCMQPVATCRQSPYLHKPAVVTVTSLSLWRLAPTTLAAPVHVMSSFSMWRHSLLSWPRPPSRTYVRCHHRRRRFVNSSLRLCSTWHCIDLYVLLFRVLFFRVLHLQDMCMKVNKWVWQSRPTRQHVSLGASARNESDRVSERGANCSDVI